MPPTITAVEPSSGHTGGRSLVRITGTGFRVQEDPPAFGKTEAPLPSVRVLFGGVEATGVAVTSDTELFCLSPIHDKGLVDVEVRNLEAEPAMLTSAIEPFNITPGSTVQVEASGRTQTVILVPGDFANMAAATSKELAAALNRFFGLSSVASGGAVELRSDAVGPGASLKIVGGTALAAIGFTVGQSAAGAREAYEVPGEHAVARGAYTFALPDLTVKSHLAATVSAFIEELERQVLDPDESGGVAWATHTDYDDKTGDLNVAYLGTLPAIVISAVDFVENRYRVAPGVQESDTDDGGWVGKDNPMLGDLQMVLLGIADNPIVLLNLIAVLRRFFKKNGNLIVPLNPELGDASDTVAYNLDWSFTTNVTTALQGGNSNVQTFGVTTWIREVQIWGIPGFATIPGLGTGTGEDTIKRGWKAEHLTIQAQPHNPPPLVDADPDYSWASIDEP